MKKLSFFSFSILLASSLHAPYHPIDSAVLNVIEPQDLIQIRCHSNPFYAADDVSKKVKQRAGYLHKVKMEVHRSIFESNKAIKCVALFKNFSDIIQGSYVCDTEEDINEVAKIHCGRNRLCSDGSATERGVMTSFALYIIAHPKEYNLPGNNFTLMPRDWEYEK